MTPDVIFTEVRAIMVELFELDSASVRLDSTVFEELDLDSIDAVDLVARLQQLTGAKIEEQAMRGVRTVADLVAVVADCSAEA